MTPTKVFSSLFYSISCRNKILNKTIHSYLNKIKFIINVHFQKVLVDYSEPHGYVSAEASGKERGIIFQWRMCINWPLVLVSYSLHYLWTGANVLIFTSPGIQVDSKSQSWKSCCSVISYFVPWSKQTRNYIMYFYIYI